MSAATRALNHT
jgi:hypothetical protein